MLKRQYQILLAVIALLATVNFTEIKAAAQYQDSDKLDINGAVVKTELYLWNRFSDLLDVFRCGIALGPGIGAEVAITNYAQLGAYANCERGMAFPHCFPPFWLVDYYEKNENAFQFHGGDYATAAFGPWRAESHAKENEVETYHFERNKWDVRAQADLALIHLYVAIRPTEIIDFFTGIVGYDFTLDDMKLDATQERKPADQFGRGLSNVLFGVIEIPGNIHRINSTEGDFAGATKGVGLGVWRFLCREVVGVVEVVTFPFGWQPIIEPAYVLDGGINNPMWKVYKPSFHKRF
jgi:putative exosortase-associated protein (TIGR04073 family)